MTTTTKTSSTLRATRLIAGTKQKYPTGSQKLSFDNADLTVDEIVGKLQALVDLRSEAETAKAAARTKVAAEQEQLPALLAFMSAYVAYLKAAYGNTPDVLGVFGLPPKKQRSPLTAKAKAAAVVKGEATRTARGTRGKVAKKEVTGGVVGVVVTPVKAGEPQPEATATTGTATQSPAAPTAASPPAATTKS
jgi:hypothetical protein